jgi:hypothetical protein
VAPCRFCGTFAGGRGVWIVGLGCGRLTSGARNRRAHGQCGPNGEPDSEKVTSTTRSNSLGSMASIRSSRWVAALAITPLVTWRAAAQAITTAHQRMVRPRLGREYPFGPRE